MNNPPGYILRSMEEKLGEKVTVKPYDVTQGITRYCLLTGTSGKKFTTMFCEKAVQMFLEEKGGNIYSKDLFLIEEENIQILSRRGIAVPEILYIGKDFIIWPYLGENMPLDETIMSPSSRLDEIVLRIIEYLAAIHCLPVNTIPHRACCTRYNLEFNYTLLEIIEKSDNDIARNVKNAGSYARLRELISNLSGTNVEDRIIKGITYNPEIIFIDGDKIHHTDYSFTGTANPFLDLVCPVSWGLPAGADEAVSKKQERVRHYLNARKIDDEQDMFLKFDYFTVLESFNMMDVMFGTSNEKTKILYKTAYRNIKNLISSNPDLNEASQILLSSIPELH